MKRIIATLAALAFVAPAQAADEKPSIESLFKLPQYASMRLSPDGEHIAALAPVNGKQNVVVINVDKRTAVPVTTSGTRDIVSVRWINGKRLLVQTGTLGTRVFDAKGGGIFAIDRDGTNARLISEGSDETTTGGARFVVRPIHIVRTLPGEGDDVIGQETVTDAQRSVPGSLYRINTRTGQKTTLSAGKPESGAGETWVVDRDGVPRAFVVTSEAKAKIYYRKDADSPWTKLDEFSTLAGDTWQPLAVAEDNRALYITSRKGRDKSAIVRYDPETKTFGEVLAAHPQIDLTNLLNSNEMGVVGVAYEADKGGVAWFDEEFAKMQSAIDRALPDTVNILSSSRDRSRYIITAVSDVSPGAFYLFDKKKNKLEWLADAMPWIDPKQMSHVTPVRYKARDGLEIPAYLTVPKDSSGKNLPMVVMVHGGPWVTGDHWYWHREVQFLASRGYAVLQPNFRGTLRYGWKHFSSSFKQWGLTMQDDITDGVRWAVDQGVADPKRVCIYGASYGGYATMMGLAKTPDLFKCGINYVGVTDLDLFLRATWSDFAYSEFLSYEMKDMFGDSARERDRLRTVSPVELAARMQAPVLMAYGASDRRVVPEHGSRMKAALEKVGKKPEYYMVDGEGHGFREMKNQVMFYGAMEKFLERNIGAPQ